MVDIHENVIATEEAPISSVYWSAIIAGALAASVVSFALLLLGSALGLSTLSPWSYPDAQAVKSFTAKTAIWLIIMQWVASGLGGYLTGRLRTKWTRAHTEEVFFRDTVHGFLTWAVATLFIVSVLTSATASLLGNGIQASAMVAAGAAARPGPEGLLPVIKQDETNNYYIDSLFRSSGDTDADLKDVRAETAKILMMGLKDGVPSEDRDYLVHIVSTRSGVDTEEAAHRVDNVISELGNAKEKAKQDAEEARKAAMRVSLYIFLSLLMGAFIASVAAAIGGKRRDEY